MQVVFELLTALVVWAASVAFAHLGIEVDLKRPEPARERVVERTRPDAAQPPTKMADEAPAPKSMELPRRPAAPVKVARPA